MPDINYYSPAGGGFRAEIPGVAGRPGAGGGAGAGFGGPPNMDWLFALAQKSAQNKLAMQQQELLRGKQDYNLRAEDAGYMRQERARAPFERQRQRLAESKAQSEAYVQNRSNTPIQNFDRARRYADSMENSNDRYTTASAATSKFRNFPVASSISGVGESMRTNPWDDLYKEAAGGPSAAATGVAGQNNQQQREQEFMLKNAGLLRFLQTPQGRV